MPEREERRAQAAKHLALMKGAFSTETEATVAAARVYEDGEGRELSLPEAAFETTETSVTTAFAPAALRDAPGTTVGVDPASFTRPGGGYEDGAFGPEQILCSESNLYPVLCGLKSAYHDGNRGCQRGQLFTDRALYLPNVAFSRCPSRTAPARWRTIARSANATRFWRSASKPCCASPPPTDARRSCAARSAAGAEGSTRSR